MLRRPTPGRDRGAARKALTDDQKQELREAFDLFDTEQTGQIDYHEFINMMKDTLGLEIIPDPNPPAEE